MVDDDVEYRYQTVKVIRGREANKISELERQGWEVDQQTSGRLRTEITFRRVVPPTRFKPWMGIAALFGVGVILLGGAAIAGAIGGDDDSDRATDKSTAPAATESTESGGTATADPPSTSAEPSDTPTAASESPSTTLTEQPSATKTPSETAQAVDEVLTLRNSPDFRKLLADGENGAVCKSFASTYAGRTIEFDGSVAVAGGGNYLVYAGDDSDTQYVPGPSFQFRTLTVDGGRPTPGDNLHFVAKVGTYSAMTGLFELSQVTTTQR